MDNRLVLLKSIILLFRESQIGLVDSISHSLISDVMGIIRPPKGRMEGNFGKDTITYLRETVKWMLESPIGTVFDRQDILMRVKVGLDGNDHLYEILEDALTDISDTPVEDEIKHQCSGIRAEFQQFIRQHRIKAIVSDANRHISFNSESVDWRHIVRELRAALEPYESHLAADEAHPGVVESFMLSDVSGTSKILSEAVNQQVEGKAIRYGWKGLNRMFGVAQGARRGEFIITPALQHNFKSGFSMMTMLHHAKYNIPQTLYPGENKKPLLVRFSFENDATLDILTIYKFLYESEHDELVDVRKVDPEVASSYVAEWVASTGWDIIIERIDPSDYTYSDMFTKLDTLQAANFEIHGLWIDYPALMSKRGCAQGPAGVEFRDLIRRIRNYTTRNKITCIAPWQLSTEAKMRLREGSNNFLSEIVGLGYYDSCRTIDQEVDTEIYLHIEKVKDNEFWLNLHLGKRRSFERTPDEDRCIYLPFRDVGTILEDVLLDEDTSRRKLRTSLMDMSASDLFGND